MGSISRGGVLSLLISIIVLLLGSISVAEGADHDYSNYPKKAKADHDYGNYPKKAKADDHDDRANFPKKAKCTIGKYKHCYNLEQNCPKSCPGSCEVDCISCKPVCSCDKPGAVCQDPRFIGGDGITFYFHGKKDRDFCLLSDANLHINAHFIGKRNPEMKRDFTWVQSIAILYKDVHRIFVGAEKTATWDDAVDRLSIAVDGERVALPTAHGATWQSNGVSITRTRATNGVTVEVEGSFKILVGAVPITKEESRVHRYGVSYAADDIEAEGDCMAHLELSFKFHSLTNDVNGVLGQTFAENYVSKVKMSAAMPVMGGDDKFSTTDLFAADCAVSRFGAAGLISTHGVITDHQAGLDCTSGLGTGTGIVCKK